MLPTRHQIKPRMLRTELMRARQFAVAIEREGDNPGVSGAVSAPFQVSYRPNCPSKMPGVNVLTLC